MILKKGQTNVEFKLNKKKERQEKEKNMNTIKCIRKEKDCLNCKILDCPEEKI